MHVHQGVCDGGKFTRRWMLARNKCTQPTCSSMDNMNVALTLFGAAEEWKVSSILLSFLVGCTFAFAVVVVLSLLGRDGKLMSR